MKIPNTSLEYEDKNTLQWVKEMAQQLRAHSALPEEQKFQFPAATSGSSQPPVISVPRDPTFSPGLHTHGKHIYAHK